MVDLEALVPLMQPYSPELLAKETGLSVIIVRRIKTGKETNPRESTIGLIYRAIRDTKPDIPYD